jgi:hypothetical protein
MSEAFHTVVPGPNLVGFGYLPVLTPAHHEVLPTGISGGNGGSACRSPKIWRSRRRPVAGIGFINGVIAVRSCLS